MIVLVCGDRNWDDEETMENFIRHLPKDTTIIHGNCRGADKMAGRLGVKYRLEVIPFDAKWDIYGRAAGPIRNKRMLDEGKPDIVVAFHRDITKSKGTKDMVRQAEKHGVEVIIEVGTK